MLKLWRYEDTSSSTLHNINPSPPSSGCVSLRHCDINTCSYVHDDTLVVGAGFVRSFLYNIQLIL